MRQAATKPLIAPSCVIYAILCAKREFRALFAGITAIVKQSEHMTIDLNILPLECQRQDYDTAASYHAFITYYLSQPPPRTLVEAYRLYRKQKDGTKAVNIKQAPGSWNYWSGGQDKHGQKIEGALTWEKRAAAYDAAIHARLEVQKQEKREREVERELSATDSLLKLFNNMLDGAPAFLKTSRIEETAPGNITRIVETVALNVPGLRQLAALHADLMQQRRLALGMAQKVTETHHGNADGKAFKLDVEHSVDELIKRAMQELEQEEGKGYE